MNWTPRASRRDVLRVISRYVRSEFSPRSSWGSVIDDSRVKNRRGGEPDLNFDTASRTEVLDAIWRAMIRQRVFAPPERRRDVKNADGTLMRCVAPRRDVAAIVQTKPTRQSNSHDNVRDWRSDIGIRLKRIPNAEQWALLGYERFMIEKLRVENELAACRSAAQRAGRGSKRTKRPKGEYDRKVSELAEYLSWLVYRMTAISKSGTHRRGVRNLLAECTRSAEVEEYVFGKMIR